eukprot:m.95383 g.95383  ORF g.95383 m.95383 type:complete len:351 (+) comp36849_c0_seq4:1196-2248(+)
MRHRKNKASLSEGNGQNGAPETFSLSSEPSISYGITMRQALLEFGLLNTSFDATTISSNEEERVPEISLNSIKYLTDLGKGAFGEVFLGRLERKELVAVKLFKGAHSEETNRENFLKERFIMAQLNHPNIVSLIGQCTRKTSPNIGLVFEFMCYGDLGKFLRKSVLGDVSLLLEVDDGTKKHQLVNGDLLIIIIQICKVCIYLEDQHFVHCDIAARNCLIGENMIAKMADFGMSRDVYSSDYYRISGRPLLPVRWMPPESIMYGKFTSKSDVWSFGVLMWEVCTLGKRPYYGKSNKEVVNVIVKGEQLNEPDELCSEEVFLLMKACWEFDPSSRVKFADALIKLETMNLD